MTFNFRSRNRKARALAIRKIQRKYRLYADGKEVTACFYYDGRRRMIGVNLLNENGQPYITPNGELAVKFFQARRVRLVKAA